MNSKTNKLVSNNVRRISGLALVMMMACSPVMAGGKPNVSEAESHPFAMEYECDYQNANAVYLQQVSDGIPVGMGFQIEYIAAQLATSSEPGSPSLYITQITGVQRVAWIPTQPGYSPANRSVSETVRIYTESDPLIRFEGVTGLHTSSERCSLTLHGYVKSI